MRYSCSPGASNILVGSSNTGHAPITPIQNALPFMLYQYGIQTQHTFPVLRLFSRWGFNALPNCGESSY
ncbi:hypothetical protein PM082_019491 [Marasmius tenuissimus]|nr:hypothetical protein PM082_019491 [Marasmius tenuissimus]